jgi:MFS family permease
VDSQPPASGPARAPWRRFIGALMVDTRPLRRREFRLLFIALTVTFAGSMITYVAIPFQVYRLTGSPLAVGLLSLAELVPLLLTALVGGALADAVDRRRMVRATEAGLLLTSAVLALNALAERPHVWLLFCAAALMAALDGLQRPSLEAVVPRLVPRDELPVATALQSLRGNVGMLAGPAIGGLLIAGAGLPAAYLVDVGSFAVSLLALTLLRAVPPPPDAERPSLRGIAEGLRYARARKDLLGTYLVDVVAMVFGMPMALFPAIAARLGGPRTLGLLYAAPAAGSLLVSAASGWMGRVHRHGLAILVAAGAWGAAVVGFGLARPAWLALLLLAAAGAADMVSGMFRTIMWNQTIPDELRGRLAGIEMLSYTTGPLLGNVEAGLLAALVGVRASVVSGGLLCVAGVALVGLALPAFRRYDARQATPREPGSGGLAPKAGATADPGAALAAGAGPDLAARAE